MRYSALLLALALSCCLAGCEQFAKLSGDSSATNGDESTDTNATTSPNVLSRVVAEGRIEPAGGVVGLYAAVGDRLIKYESNTTEGMQVSAGQQLGEMLSYRTRIGELNALTARVKESAAMRDAQQAASEADVKAAETTIEQVADTATRLPVKETEIALLKNTLEAARSECKKLTRLASRSDLVSGSAIEKSKLAVQQAKTAVEVAEAEYKSLQGEAKSQLNVAKAKRDSIAASHDRALAMIPFDSLNEQVKSLKELVNETRLPAPISGTILKINSKPGEAVVNEPLLLIADLSEIVCVTEVYETYISRLKVGQSATLRSLTFGDDNPLEGKIESIGRIIMTPDLKPLDPFAKADVRVVEVRIKVDPGKHTDVASKLINLQVDVEIETGN